MADKKKFKTAAPGVISNSCERLRVVVGTRSGSYSISVRTSNDTTVGQMYATRRDGWHRETPNALVIDAIKVDDNYHRCGIGTRLYEAAATLARSERVQLVSDELRTKCSDSFWQKQVAKGRAVCGKSVRRYTAKHEMGCGNAVMGRSACLYYALKSGRKNLSGGRRGR